MSCNYVLSGAPTLDIEVRTTLTRHLGYISDETVGHFLDETVNKFLISYGVGIDKGDPFDGRKVGRRCLKRLKLKEREFLKNSEIILDSGGYQVQLGYIVKEDTTKMIDSYYKFLADSINAYDSAFCLDIAPGPIDSIYSTWDEMERYNRLSYERCIELPEEVKKKVYYIHHFRTPMINKIWKKLLFEDHMDEHFDNFSTGGLVSFSKSAAKTPPMFLYVIPLVHLLIRAKERGLKKFTFHALGMSEFKDILIHRFMEKHIKEVHDIDVQITYDSSTIFRALMLSRYCYVYDDAERTVTKLSIRTDNLNLDWRGRGRGEDVFYGEMNKVARQYGFKEIDKETFPIYITAKDGVSRMNQIISTYSTFTQMKVYSDVGDVSKQIVEELYPMYLSGDYIEFDKAIELQMIKFNNNRYTKSVGRKCMSISKSLNVLKDLDMDYCEHVISSFLAQDECQTLFNKKQHVF